MEKNDIFVTYSWDNEEHMKKVVEFVNFLRKSGYEADLDRNIVQNNTAMQFKQMMHEGLSASKVIIVLSEGYKNKAEAFKGGVGVEYRTIIEDIDKNYNKYILVSFDSIDDRVMPMMFSGRYIIDLKKDEKEGFNELFSKLSDERIIELAPVGEKKPIIKKEMIGEFSLSEEKGSSSDVSYKVNIQNQVNNNFEKEAVISMNFGSGITKVRNHK
ncbi:SEFIR domain-containing protein [Oceanirhabdus sp. W0125-5]|uniref:SEFIR domain-containing protein n=1 Tax=Oceanirhabdus sp. W0125-5 TaxID=2999116 RepID=UPI0022F2B6A1|nr:SEFIR domain-containing protein [Oceanirhabdus sp. W0125-5]WBW98853.1 TIR domain-containing protein [Oceanirhabdus sp. W0125-5]